MQIRRQRWSGVERRESIDGPWEEGRIWGGQEGRRREQRLETLGSERRKVVDRAEFLLVRRMNRNIVLAHRPRRPRRWSGLGPAQAE